MPILDDINALLLENQSLAPLIKLFNESLMYFINHLIGLWRIIFLIILAFIFYALIKYAFRVTTG